MVQLLDMKLEDTNYKMVYSNSKFESKDIEADLLNGNNINNFRNNTNVYLVIKAKPQISIYYW